MFHQFICVLWLLFMASCSAQSTGGSKGESTGSEATSCEACHTLARCHTSLHDNSVETVGVSCRCEDGVVGDGFTCYNQTTCDDGCCGRGYHWSPLQGCVDINECLLPHPPCTPDQLCENTRGSYTCLVKAKLHHTTAKTRARSVMFTCGGTQCPFGQDCLRVNGTTRCIDPCQHYSPLQDAWRASDVRVDPASVACDSNTDWQGWYRLFIGDSSVQMPERCIQSHMCGTDAPLWLRTPHPLDSEGIVRAEVCGSWERGCCQFESNLIHVKACPRNYYVYKFVSPTFCRLAYCADINTAVCSTCAEGETCVSSDKINWSCGPPAPESRLRLVNGGTPCSGRVEILHNNQWGTVCDDGWTLTNTQVVCRQLRCGPAEPGSHIGAFGQGTGQIWIDDVACTGSESTLSECGHRGFGAHDCSHVEDIGVICSEDTGRFPEPELVCGQDHLRLMVQKRLLEERGLNASSAHLIDPHCYQQIDHQEAMWYLVERRKGTCGNMVETNGTHITYSNILFVYPAARSDVSLSIPMSIPFSCVFPLDDITSLNAAIRYQTLSGSGGVVRSGDPSRALMTLFKRPDYSEPFPAGPVSLPLGSALHIGVSVENFDNNGFVLLLENCYITNSPAADDPVRHFLIHGRCPVDRRQVTVVENGLSQRARFSALFFLFHGTYEDTYLHCRISLCNQNSAPCRPSCSRRRARSAVSSNQLPVTVGPISWF